MFPNLSIDQIIVGFGWPMIFVVIAIIANKLVVTESRGKHRLFRVIFLRHSDRYQTSSLVDIQTLRTKLTQAIQNPQQADLSFISKDVVVINDIQELEPGIVEIKLGIDLCVTAASATVANIIALSNNSSSDPSTLALFNTAFILFALNLITLLLIVFILRGGKDIESFWQRVGIIWLTNFFGLVIMIVSFISFGRLFI